MAAPITDYTTYDDIRAALGVSAKDLKDDTLALAIYSSYLEIDLEDVNPTLPTTYATIQNKTPPLTAEEVRILSTVQFFATYSVAKHLSVSLPIFAPKQIADGKASLQRFDNPYKDMIAGVNQMYDAAKNRVIAALGSATTKTPLVYFSTVAPDTDFVTGQ